MRPDFPFPQVTTVISTAIVGQLPSTYRLMTLSAFSLASFAGVGLNMK
jgi:hypothetical protein